MSTSYGLDLAGFSAGKSALAGATFDECHGFRVAIYRDHPFIVELEGRDLIGPHAGQERALLRVLNPLYVDVPIDLQGLPSPACPTFTWELTKRPVDFGLVALPPLADRIGTPVARMQNLLRGVSGDLLGTQLFETYPKASLAFVLGVVPSYKGQTAEFSAGQWVGEGGLAEVLRRLRVHASEGTVLNDDHLDALVCSLTGVVPAECVLRGPDLEAKVRERLEQKVRAADRAKLVTTLPAGYVLIGKLPDLPIHVSLEDQPPVAGRAK